MKITRLCENLLMFVSFSLSINSVFLTEARININKTDSIIKPLNNGSFAAWLARLSSQNGSTGDLVTKPSNRSEENLNFIKCPKILRSKSCHGYARRWIRFYVKIGGWIMLSVIAVGLFFLISTHCHIVSKKSVNNNSRSESRQQTSLVEVMAKRESIDV